MAVELPGYWDVTSFTVTDTSTAGSLETPTFTYRFEAVATLAEDTFKLQTQNGLITLVTPVTDAGQMRTVRGTATSSREDDVWLTEVTFEGLEGLEVGLPKDLFPGRVIVQGSAEEMAYRAELDT